MFSPALRHRQEKLARHAAQAAAGMSGRTLEPGAAPEMPEEGPVASEYRQLLIPLHEDLRALKSVQSMENKAAFKATATEKYLDWCRGAIATPEGEAAPQDEIVATCLIWAIDIRRWQLALDLAGHMTRHGLSLPEHYKRSVAALLVSEMGDAAINDPRIRKAFSDVSANEIAQEDQTPEALGRLLHSEIERWGKVIKAANIEPMQ